MEVWPQTERWNCLLTEIVRRSALVDLFVADLRLPLVSHLASQSQTTLIVVLEL